METESKQQIRERREEIERELVDISKKCSRRYLPGRKIIRAS